jgi:hypothetical protein
MALKQIKSLVQFARGTSVVLNELTTPIPDGVVVFSIDDGMFKLGDGVTLYPSLPSLFSYTDLLSAQGGISGKFEEPTIDQNGKIVVVTYDQLTNTIKYGVSETSLQSLLDSISALEATEADQTDAIAVILAKALSLDINISTANDNNVIVINSRRYMSSGQTLSNIQSQIAAQVTYVPGSHLEEINFYTTADKSKAADQMDFADGSTYYADIIGFNNNESTLVYGLTAANSNVVINQVSGSLFSIQLNDVTGGVKDNTPFVLIASIDNQAGTAKVEKAISCLGIRQKVILATYGGVSTDSFFGACNDSEGNLYVVGWTASEGTGYYEALIVKFDSSLNILARKIYGGSGGDDKFNNVNIDANDNIYAVGQTTSEGVALTSCFVIKFNSSLNKLAGKVYGGSSNEYFLGVDTDSLGNVYAVGYTASEGSGSDVVVIKFDSSLNKLAGKRYGGAQAEYAYGIALDSADNVYIAGYTITLGTSGSALIVKLDSSLALVLSKYYGGASGDIFNDIAIDSSDNIYVVGNTNSEGVGSSTYPNSLIVKFDTSLNIVARKYYGGSLADQFKQVKIAPNGNVIAVGFTTSVGLSGPYDGFMTIFDGSLNVVSSKVYGGTSSEYSYLVSIANDSNIYVGGSTQSDGAGGEDGFIIKFPGDVPSGSFTGAVLTGITMSDITTFTLADSTLTLSSGSLTLADSALTLANSALTLANSTLTLEKDTLN